MWGRPRHKQVAKNARVRKGGTWTEQANRLARNQHAGLRKRRGEMNTWTTQANRLDRQRKQREQAERRAGNRLRKLLGHHRRLQNMPPAETWHTAPRMSGGDPGFNPSREHGVTRVPGPDR